jgi:hypothetical protein
MMQDVQEFGWSSGGDGTLATLCIAASWRSMLVDRVSPGNGCTEPCRVA